MRQAAAALQHLLISDPPEPERDAQLARHVQLVREATRKPSVRRRAGEALIAVGVRLAGEPARATAQPPTARKLAGRVA